MNAEALNQHLPYVGSALDINKNAQNYTNAFNSVINQPQQRYNNVEPSNNVMMYNQNNGYSSNMGYGHNGHLNNYNGGMYQQYGHSPIQVQVSMQQNALKLGSNVAYNNNDVQSSQYGYNDLPQAQGQYGYNEVQSQTGYYAERSNYQNNHHKSRNLSISERNSERNSCERGQIVEEQGHATKRKRMAS